MHLHFSCFMMVLIYLFLDLSEFFMASLLFSMNADSSWLSKFRQILPSPRTLFLHPHIIFFILTVLHEIT